MHISLEASSKHTVMAYSDTQIKINNTTYCENIIVDANTIDTSWNQSGTFLSEDAITSLIKLQPEVILIGCDKARASLTPESIKLLVQAGVGIEIMSIGASCRTFNVLLSEGRKVALGVIFN